MVFQIFLEKNDSFIGKASLLGSFIQKWGVKHQMGIHMVDEPLWLLRCRSKNGMSMSMKSSIFTTVGCTPHAIASMELTMLSQTKKPLKKFKCAKQSINMMVLFANKNIKDHPERDPLLATQSFP